MTDELDLLGTDELRQRALGKAQDAKDVGFLWDLVKHMRASQAIAGEDGSSGAITGSITELVHLVRELTGRQPLGEDEPLLRARFLDYLKA
jgi:hypothetical protein